jgi:hypothetical protein
MGISFLKNRKRRLQVQEEVGLGFLEQSIDLPNKSTSKQL